MTDNDQPDGRGTCAESDCDRQGSFWRYDGEGGWLPICDRHARHLHPSLEVHAWLEAGYMRPIEREPPEGPPPEPSVERGRAFRAEIDAVLGWSD